MPLDVGGTRSTRREPPRSRGGFANSFFYAMWSFLNVHKMAEINQFSNHRSLYLSSISVSSLSCLDFECRFLWISLFPSSVKVSRGVYCSRLSSVKFSILMTCLQVEVFWQSMSMWIWEQIKAVKSFTAELLFVLLSGSVINLFVSFHLFQHVLFTKALILTWVKHISKL